MSEKDRDNIIEFKQLKEAENNIKKDDELSYDNKKLNRLLFIFDKLLAEKAPEKDLDDIYHFFRLQKAVEFYVKKFLNRIIEEDRTILPIVLILKILDRLNEYEAPNSLLMDMLIYKVVEEFPEYFEDNNEYIQMLEYFNREVDLNKYKTGILVNILYMFTSIKPDSGSYLREFLKAFKKLTERIADYKPEELPQLANIYLALLVQHFIESFARAGMPFDKMLENLDKIKYHYGAQCRVVQFLIANDAMELAYDQLMEMRNYQFPEELYEFDEELAIPHSATYNFFCYLALCFDMYSYFEDIFPDFIDFLHDPDKVAELLTLYKALVGDEHYKQYIESLINGNKIDKSSKKELKDLTKKGNLRL